VSSSHVVIDPEGNERSLCPCLRENRNKRKQIASLEAPLIFKVPQTSGKICKLGSSMGVPPN